MHPQILGFLRFSFFGPSDTKLDYSDRQAAFDRLYSPRRMETRFQLFEHMVLPGFRAQTDPDFKLVVLSSAVMPEGYRTRLAQLCASLPQIERARDQLREMLKNDGPTPDAPFDGFEVLRPAREYKNRHASILLSIEATAEAMAEALQSA